MSKDASARLRVSVIIPTRNNLDVLPKALDSVWSQPVAGMEVIVADDGSTDGTSSWLADLSAREPRLRVLETGGIGPAGARNAALAAARAPLAAFLDSDDWWHAGKLARQLVWHERWPGVVLSFTDYLHVDPDGGSHGTCFDFWRPTYRHAVPHSYGLVVEAEADLLGTNVVGTSTVMASIRHILDAGAFSTALPSAEDWDLWLRLAAVGPIGCSSIVTTSYLMRPGSETRRREARIGAMEAIIGRYRDRADPSFRAAVRLADARVSQARAELARDQGDVWRALRFELAAMVAAPSMRNARTAFNGLTRGTVAPPRQAA